MRLSYMNGPPLRNTIVQRGLLDTKDTLRDTKTILQGVFLKLSLSKTKGRGMARAIYLNVGTLAMSKGLTVVFLGVR